MSSFVIGLPVVISYGKDRDIYYIREILNDQVSIWSHSRLNPKIVSVSSIREADDYEIMVGTRLK